MTIFLFVAFAASLLPSVRNYYRLFAVMSGSMGKSVPVGSLIAVFPQSNYKVGDVITFKSPASAKSDSTTTHRIAEKRALIGATAYLTKGDANQIPDRDRIFKENIVGKVLVVAPYLGYLLHYPQTPIGSFFIVVVATLIISKEISKFINIIKPPRKIPAISRKLKNI